MQLLELTEDENKVRSHETMQKSRKSRTSYSEKYNCRHVGLFCVYDLLVFEGSSCLQLLSGIINSEQGISKNNLNGATWLVCFDFNVSIRLYFLVFIGLQLGAAVIGQDSLTGAAWLPSLSPDSTTATFMTTFQKVDFFFILFSIPCKLLG